MTVLVIDGDDSSRRIAEETLTRADFVVETAPNGTAAGEILQNVLVDLILCDFDLEDFDGLALFRRLTGETRLRNVPFVLWTEGLDVRRRVAAYRAGVHGFLSKPVDADELVALTENLVLRQRRAREAARARSFALAGTLEAMALPDLVVNTELGRRTGALSILTPVAAGRLFFQDGQLYHAECGNLLGPQAFNRLFREEAGYFEFVPGPGSAATRTIQGSATSLILEAARVMDTERRDVPEQDDVPDIATRPDAAWLLAGPKPDMELALQLETALLDPFAFGQLASWTSDNLLAWTSRNTDTKHIHIHLVTSPEAGIGPLLALAGAPTERWVMDTLSQEPKVFGLTFFLRNELTVDVVLLDSRQPDAMLTSMRRAPTMTLVCPPGGNILEVGITGRVGLERLLESLTPRVILGVGGASIRPELSALEVVRTGQSILHCTDGSWGDGGEDLRQLVIEGLRVWALTGERGPMAGDKAP